MLSILSLKSTRLQNAECGTFFMPREQTGDRFIVGAVNTRFPVAIELGAKQFFFHDLPVLDGRRGFLVADFEFMVDPASSVAARGSEQDHVPLGSMILHGNNVGILCAGRNNIKAFVSVRGDAIPEDADAVAFTSWRAVWLKEGHEPYDLFSVRSGDAYSLDNLT